MWICCCYCTAATQNWASIKRIELEVFHQLWCLGRPSLQSLSFRAIEDSQQFNFWQASGDSLLFPVLSIESSTSFTQCQCLPDIALVFSYPALSACTAGSGNDPLSRSTKFSSRCFVLDAPIVTASPNPLFDIE